MFRPGLIVGLLPLVSISHAALTLTIDQGLTIVSDPTDTTTMWITGVLDNSSVSTTNQATSASLVSMTVTGLTTPGSIYGGILGGFVQGVYVGKLFSFPIPPNTPTGDYSGKVKMSIRFAKLSPVTTPLLDFSFSVTDSASPVPEPQALSALGIGFAALIHRRRR